MSENQNEAITLAMPTGEIKDNRLDNIEDKNEVRANGVIVNKFDTGKVTLVKIMVRGGRKLDIYNYPQFVFMGEAKKQADAFSTGDHVEIVAYADSRYLAAKQQFSESLMGVSIERTPSRLAEFTTEQGLGRVRKFPLAEFFIAGSVQRVEVVNNQARLVIKAKDKNGRSTYANCYMYPQNMSKFIEDTKKGNRVCAVGEVQTKKIEEEGKKTQFIQRNVITDISSIDNVLSLK